MMMHKKNIQKRSVTPDHHVHDGNTDDAPHAILIPVPGPVASTNNDLSKSMPTEDLLDVYSSSTVVATDCNDHCKKNEALVVLASDYSSPILTMGEEQDDTARTPPVRNRVWSGPGTGTGTGTDISTPSIVKRKEVLSSRETSVKSKHRDLIKNTAGSPICANSGEEEEKFASMAAMVTPVPENMLALRNWREVEDDFGSCDITTVSEIDFGSRPAGSGSDSSCMDGNHEIYSNLVDFDELENDELIIPFLTELMEEDADADADAKEVLEAEENSLGSSSDMSISLDNDTISVEKNEADESNNHSHESNDGSDMEISLNSIAQSDDCNDEHDSISFPSISQSMSPIANGACSKSIPEFIVTYSTTETDGKASQVDYDELDEYDCESSKNDVLFLDRSKYLKTISMIQNDTLDLLEMIIYQARAEREDVAFEEI